MTQFISHIHDEFRKARLTRRGSTHKPKDVPMGVHKAYVRMQEIALPEPRNLEVSLADVLQRRKSYSGGKSDGALTLEEWGTLFGLALGKHEKSLRRHYPSGGTLYPIETYIVTRLQNDTFTLFHYNPSLHAFEVLWDLDPAFDIKQLVRKPDDLLFSSLIIFTSCWRRSSAKYGDFTYTPALLEAGHMSENVLLVATALGLPSRPMAAFDDEKIIEILDLDPDYEHPVHTVVISTRETR